MSPAARSADKKYQLPNQTEVIPLSQEPWCASSHFRSILREKWVEAGLVFPWNTWRVVLWNEQGCFVIPAEKMKAFATEQGLLGLLPLGMQTDTCFTGRARYYQGRECKPPSVGNLSFDFYWHDKAVQHLFEVLGGAFWISAGHRKQLRPSCRGSAPPPLFWPRP